MPFALPLERGDHLASGERRPRGGKPRLALLEPAERIGAGYDLEVAARAAKDSGYIAGQVRSVPQKFDALQLCAVAECALAKLYERLRKHHRCRRTVAEGVAADLDHAFRHDDHAILRGGTGYQALAILGVKHAFVGDERLVVAVHAVLRNLRTERERAAIVDDIRTVGEVDGLHA